MRQAHLQAHAERPVQLDRRDDDRAGHGRGNGINDVGQIVANSQGAFVISGGTRTTLPDLSSYGGGGFSGATRINNHQSAVCAINDNGQSVAGGSNARGQEHAFLLAPS